MPFSHGDAEAHPPHRTEPEIAGRFRFTRKHAHNGIRLCLVVKSVVLCTISLGNDEEPFFYVGGYNLHWGCRRLSELRFWCFLCAR